MFSNGDAYEQYMGRWSRSLATRLIEFAGVADGDDVLDVGSGTGALSHTLRDQTKTTKITGIDPAKDFVAYATSKNTEPRVRFEVGDAQQMRFPDGTFDETIALLVMSFIPDPAKGLSEMVRVTKPGGVVVAAVWDYTEGMQPLRIFWDEAVALDPSLEPRDEKHMPLSHEGELAGLWQQAGLEHVVEEPLTITFEYRSFADYWSPFLQGQGPGGACVTTLPKERQTQLEQRLRKRLLGDGPDHPFELSASVWAVKGTKHE